MTMDQFELNLFALLCVERLVGCFGVFCTREKKEHLHERFINTLNDAYHSAGNSPSVDASSLDQLIHDSEEFGDPLAIQAQAAAISLFYAMQTSSDAYEEQVSWCASKTIDAIENLTYWINKVRWRVDTLSTIMQRELLWQKELTDTPILTQSDISTLRTENVAYAIYPAI